MKDELQRARSLVNSAKEEMAGYPSVSIAQADVENADLVNQIQSEFKQVFESARSALDDIATKLSPPSLTTLNDRVRTWEALKADFDTKYERAKASAHVNQQQLQRILETEKRITKLKKLQAERRSLLSTLVDPEKSYTELREHWAATHKEKVNLLSTQCNKFSELSNGLIKAEITNSLAIDRLKQKLKAALAGMNIREQKIDDLCQCALTAEDPMTEWNTILAEFEALAHHNAGGAEALPQTKVLTGCGYIDSERTRIASSFTPEKWLELSVTELEFNPVFR